MPSTVYTSGTLTNLSYDDLVSWINLSSGGSADIDAWLAQSANYGIGEIEALENLAGAYMNFYKDGNGKYTITSFNNTAQVSNISPVDSNMSTIARGNVQTPLNRSFNSLTGKLNITRYPASGSLGQRAGYVLGSVGSAFAAVSSGITLGKVIAGAMYDSMPDYWDGIGWNTLNPQTWNSITNGNDSWQAGLLNMILGLDPDTGNSQLYMNQDAFAYMALLLKQNGWFSSSATIADNPPDGLQLSSNFYPFTLGGYVYTERSNPSRYGYYEYNYNNNIILFYDSSLDKYRSIVFSTESNQPTVVGQRIWHKADGTQDITDVTSIVNLSNTFTYDGKTVYYNYGAVSLPSGTTLTTTINNPLDMFDAGSSNTYGKQAWLAAYNSTTITPVDGVSNQPNATLPDTSTWTDPASTLQSLQNQYPSLFANPLVWDNVQPDGTNPQQVYIPVATPTASNALNNQPIGGDGTQTQQNTQVQPTVDPQTLLDLLTRTMTQTNPQTEPATDTDTQTPPSNPVDTGTGSTSSPTAPTGSASALWSVYHPTQAQINSFGAWLWGSVFTTDIRKLFEDPIQGVISLHKVFAPPVDSGSGNIVVGTLDSGVSSATVNQQYVTVDCGSVSCGEDFGSVFDYAPFTSVSLFLPFIGIVPLDVSDVMRSTIHVIYGVDVFTGACLAMVEISRDGNTVNMYQYSGVASVEYPLTNLQQSNILSGLLSIAGGVAMTVASGGVGFAAGAAMVGGAAQAANTHIGRSGGFSGNAGAMGIKKPYLIIVRPQTKVADTFPLLEGYPTNYSCKLSECSNHVVVSHVHVEGINATETELEKIESLLKEGVLV